jgi:hypothetical protein
VLARLRALGAARGPVFNRGDDVFIPRQTVYWWPQRKRGFGTVMQLRWRVEIWRRQ